MDNPLGHCADLKAIFRRQAGAWLDRETLGRVSELCRSAAQASADDYCAAELGRVSHYAKQLYSHRDLRTDALREQILLTLESIEHRL
jgi:hypothetical protein